MKFSVKRRPKIADDGKPLIVLRPKDPAFAIQIANLALNTNDTDLLANLPDEDEAYTVVGYLAEGGKGEIIDNNGRVIGECKAGDSLVTRKD